MSNMDERDVRIAELEARLADKNKEIGELTQQCKRHALWEKQAKDELAAAHKYLDEHNGPGGLRLPPKTSLLVQRLADFAKMYGHGLGDQCKLVKQLVNDYKSANDRTDELLSIIDEALGRHGSNGPTWEDAINDRRTALRDTLFRLRSDVSECRGELIRLRRTMEEDGGAA